MDIVDLLRPEAVKVVSNASSKKALLSVVADLAGQCYDMSAETVLRALQEREALGPTAVGHGVALPHARLQDVLTVRAVFIRLDKPIDFGAVDRKPVDLFFGLFAPEAAGVEHLKALALVSRTMRDPSTCEKLRANESPETIYTILTEAQRQQAA